MSGVARVAVSRYHIAAKALNSIELDPLPLVTRDVTRLHLSLIHIYRLGPLAVVTGSSYEYFINPNEICPTLEFTKRNSFLAGCIG